MDNRSYFLLSGFISFLFFSLVVVTILVMMMFSSSVKTFALNKDNYVSISLENIDTKSLQSAQQSKSDVVVEDIAQESKEVNVEDLFSDVWTKKITIKKEEKKVDTRRLDQIKKKIKKSEDKRVEELFVASNSAVETINDANSKKSSSASEVNEYLAKIQAIVYKHFRPPKNSVGYSVRAVIELSAIGKVIDFRILTYSANQALNAECDNMKDRLMSELFPKNPDNVSSITKIDLIPRNN